jgi:3-oxoacyl-[acyl-carrier-protein] synthase II
MNAYINSIYTLPIQEIPSTDGFKIDEPNYADILGGGGDLRRMSRLVKMGMYASQKCINNSENKSFESIVVGTGLGGVECSEKFLSGLIDGEQNIQSPTPFIQSLPNSIAGQIALKHSCYGYVMTYVHRGFSFETALYDGLMLVEENKNTSVLVGGLDELTVNYVESMRQAGHLKAGENLTGTILGEGATFLKISKNKTEKYLAKILGMELLYHPNLEKIKETLDKILLDNNLTINSLDAILMGACGDVNLDEKINKIQEVFTGKSINYFKNKCGDYYTSSGYAIQTAIDIVDKLEIDRTPKFAFIINHYRDINYSIYLLEL